MRKIKKAVIPVAGVGTRFLPFTKTVPKEMLPILNKPTIHYIVEEAVQAGIEEIIFIISPSKQSIEQYFHINNDLESFLESKNKKEEIPSVREQNTLAKFKYIVQAEPKGLGHAVFLAKEFIKDEPFALLLGDNVFSPERGVLPTKELIEAYEKYENKMIIGIKKVPEDMSHLYGVVTIDKKINDNNFIIESIIEKPLEFKTDKAMIGRYILNPKIFNYLGEMNIDKITNEVQLTDSLQKIILEEDLIASEVTASFYDLGSLEGFVKAQIDFALKDKKIGEEIIKHIKKTI